MDPFRRIIDAYHCLRDREDENYPLMDSRFGHNMTVGLGGIGTVVGVSAVSVGEMGLSSGAEAVPERGGRVCS